MRQVWWSLLALVGAVGLGLWTLNFAGVIDIGGTVAAQLRRMPLVADYLSAYDKGVDLEATQQAMLSELQRREEELRKLQQELANKEKDLERARLELDARSRALDEREAKLVAQERAIAEARSIDKAAQELLDAVGQMRPEQAAPMIEQLPLELARRVLGSMEPRQAGAVLGRLNPSFASRLLEVIAQTHPAAAVEAAPAPSAGRSAAGASR